MIFNLVLWAISFILTALLAPKPNIENAKSQNLGDIDFPRAGEGFPVTKVWGTVRVNSPNTLWYGDFSAVAITKRIRTGLFSKKTVTTGYMYYLGMDLGLCLGPGVRLLHIYVDKDTIWEGVASTETTIHIDLPELFGGTENGSGGLVGDIDFYPGNFTQSASSYLDSKLGEEVPAYIGVSHLVFKSFYIGTSAQLRTMAFELDCFTNSLELTGNKHKIGVDANPMEVLYDAMVTGFGGMQVDPSLINKATFIDVAEKLFDENHGISVCMDGSNGFKDFAVEILRQVDGIIYQHPRTGLIEARLIRNDYDLTELATYDADEITEISNVSKTLWSETFNQIRMVYKSRMRDYEDTAAYAEDMGNISFQGRPKSTQVNFPLCKNDSLASYLAFRELTKLANPLFAFSLTTNRSGAELLPGDVILINFPKYNITGLPLRVQRIDEGDYSDGRVKLGLYQDQYSVTDAVYATTVTPGLPSPSINPVSIESGGIFVLPFFIVNQQEEVALKYSTHDVGTSYTKNELLVMFAIRPDAATDNYELYHNESTTETGPLLLPSYVGESGTTVIYPPHCELFTAIIKTNGFVDGSMSIIVSNFYRPLASQSIDDAQDGANLMFINDEIMLVTTVANNFDGTYTLTVRRGALDTRPQSHAAGSKIFFLEDIDPMISSPFNVGEWAHIKPIGVFSGTKRLSLDDQTDFKAPVVRRRDLPVAPNYLRINGNRAANMSIAVGETYTLTWRIRNRLRNNIALMTDASETANANEAFEIDLFQGGVAYNTQTVSGSTATLNFTIPSVSLGLAEIRIRAKSTVDTSYSYQAESYPVNVISGYLLLDDGTSHELVSGDAQETGKDAIILSE